MKKKTITKTKGEFKEKESEEKGSKMVGKRIKSKKRLFAKIINRSNKKI
ncbi:hypothetical protein [Fusobacterium polymorphum]